MWSNPRFLKLCEALKTKRGEVPLQDGMKVARGFADLGYEEFLLLPGGKLLSLYSGQVTPFPEQHANFFFEVPAADEISDRIVRELWDIQSLTFEDQRSWKARLKHSKTGESREFTAPTIEELFVTALTGVSG